MISYMPRSIMLISVAEEVLMPLALMYFIKMFKTHGPILLYKTVIINHYTVV